MSPYDKNDPTPSPFPRHVGVDLESIATEKTVASLLLEEKHCNAHGIAHGGAIFTLADSAFGVAENQGERKFVALEMHVRYVRPAFVGQRLTATATLQHQGRQTAFYRIDVTDEKDRLIAALTGTGHVF